MFSLLVRAFLALVFALGEIGSAQEAKTVNTPASTSALKDGYERDIAMLIEESKAASAPLLKEYVAELDALAAKFREEGRGLLAIAARTEKARAEAGMEIVEEKSSSAPFEVLSARNGYLEKRRARTKEFEGKISERAGRYIGALREFVAAQGANADAARDFFDAEQVRLIKEGRIAPRSLHRTRKAGGGGGGPFEEVGGEDALLTGLVAHTGDFAGHRVLIAVQPIFRTANSTKMGKRHGVGRGNGITLDAKPGYAVGGVTFHSGDRIDGLEIIFMKVKPDRLGLDVADSYKSAWVGGRGGGPIQVAATGNPIVGIFGASGLELDSLGLIELQPAPDSKPQSTPVKEVSRANPATLEVANLAASPLNESANGDGGKWRAVPEAFRGAQIYCSGPNKLIGVAEYKVTKPGRVYLACNFEFQGNPSDGWTEQRWLPGDFEANGWSRVDGAELRSWGDRSFIIFTREVKAGETGKLRCNKYEPPYFITFNP